MVEKGCDNCYYTYFDEKAYPCSLCIRGVERTDQWQPSKKTKAEQTEPQTAECPFDDTIPCEWVCTEYGKCKYKPKTEPQRVTYNPTSVNNIWEKPTNPYIPNEQTEPQTENE